MCVFHVLFLFFFSFFSVISFCVNLFFSSFFDVACFVFACLFVSSFFIVNALGPQRGPKTFEYLNI